jgi:Mn2+/Fe2+ NRAMP family transporter
VFKSFRNRLKQLGPAFVIAAVVLGPGSITLSTMAGSLYGYRLLWVSVLATVFMIVFTTMAARIGLVTQQTLLELTAARFGKGLAIVGGLTGFLAILAFQAGNSAAVGFSGDAIFGHGPRIWAFLIFLPALLLLHLPELYKRLEQFVKIAVGLMILSFAGTLSVVGIDLRQIPASLVPGFPDSASAFLAVGMAATTFSVAGAAYQCYLVKEKRWTLEDDRKQGLDTLLGIAALGLISSVILMTSAGVAASVGAKSFTAQTMVLQLEPLAGRFAFALFMVGFFAASFSSLVVNPLIGATLLIDGFGGDSRMAGRPVRLGATLIMGAGAGLVVLYGETPIELLRTAQALAVIAFPVLGFLIWWLARDRSILGDRVNRWWMDILAALGYFTVVAVVLNYLRQLLG